MRAAVLLVIAACGGGGIAAEDYVAGQREALCAQEARCGLFPDQATCEAWFPLAATPSFLARIAAGELTYDADKAEECINDVRNAPCEVTAQENRDSPAACLAAVTGNIGDGDSCAADETCQSRMCAIPDCADACCMGTCVPTQTPAKRGEPCATRACDVGLTCDNTNTCADLFTAGKPCDDYTQCAYGLGCLGDPGICKQVPKRGEPCPDGACADVGDVCNAAGTCVAQGLPGAACTTSTDCSFYFPCDPTTLLCAPWPALGEACDSLCRDGLYCDPTAKQCVEPLANGMPCQIDGDCASTFCSGAKTCADPAVCL